MPPESQPPRDDLIRAIRPGVELRAVDDGAADAPPVMFGHFAVFNEWSEINSIWEGNFLERIAPGAFRKTFRENRADIKVLFQHGHDFQIGEKPLGPIDDLREDPTGAYYEVTLLDAPYVRNDIQPGLEAGVYGASFRFTVMRQEIVEDPGATDANPKGLPERTIKEVRLYEFGPVTFPAYPSATAGVRSLTDEFILGRFAHKPERLRELVEAMQRNGSAPAALDAGATPHLEPARRVEPTSDAGATPHLAALAGQSPRRFRSRKEYLDWILTL